MPLPLSFSQHAWWASREPFCPPHAAPQQPWLSRTLTVRSGQGAEGLPFSNRVEVSDTVQNGSI